FWTSIEISSGDSTKRRISSGHLFDAIKENKISAPAVVSLLFITHLFHKKKELTSEENVYRFDYFLNTLSATDLGNNYSSIVPLLQKVKDTTISIAEANSVALALLGQIGITSSASFFLTLKFYAYRIRNRFLNLSTITPIIGPDGVGKGSVSAKSLLHLKKWVPFPFKQLYRVKGLYKARLSFVSNWRNQPNNASDEGMGYYIFFIALLMLPILRLVKSSKKTLLDRYFIDYYASPIRYVTANQVPKKLRFYKWLLYFTPVPNHMVFLGCSDDSLTARKNELPLVSVHFLQRLYCEFITEKRVPMVLFLSTENEVETTSEVLYQFLSTVK
ncbi:MAG: hypothetical protein Q8K02_14280, partial [Flavobacterium sp.]|nr:hypothetical protein [Flavobacterium sp.]